ncbi:glycosyl transferase, partial [Paracoccus sp. S4493]
MDDGRNGSVKQIICIKWGAKFGPEYVNRLHAMIARNITPPFRLFCFTDDGTGLHPDVAVRPLPDFAYQAPVNTRGKWPKSRLWGDLGDVTGVVLFLDLDVIVTGSLDAFFEHGDPDDTILGLNPNTPFEKMGQTSVYRMR